MIWRFFENLCAALLLAAIIGAAGYAWLLHVEAQREGVVVVQERGE